MSREKSVNDFAQNIQDILYSSNNSIGGIKPYSQPSPDVLAKLSDLDFLNNDKEAPNVWDALSKLPPIECPVLNANRPAFSAASPEETRTIHDNSICISCPINAKSAEEVTLTPYRFVTEVQRTNNSKNKSWWRKFWGTHRRRKWHWHDCNEAEQEALLESAVLPDEIKIIRRVFYPPTDAISLHASWWGYQIFFPHDAVVAMGDSMGPFTDTLTTLTSVLAFLSTGLPAYFATIPGASMIVAIVPIVSTIIAAILWGWKGILSLDKGHGFILSATWVLPIIVAPMTWDIAKHPTSPPEEENTDQPTGTPEKNAPTTPDTDVPQDNAPSVPDSGAPSTTPVTDKPGPDVPANTPSTDSPAEDQPKMPAAETPKTTPVKSDPVPTTPVETTPVKDTPTEPTPIDSAPNTDAPTDSTPVETTPVVETPETSPIGTPVADSPSDATPVPDDSNKEKLEDVEAPADEEKCKSPWYRWGRRRGGKPTKTEPVEEPVEKPTETPEIPETPKAPTTEAPPQTDTEGKQNPREKRPWYRRGHRQKEAEKQVPVETAPVDTAPVETTPVDPTPVDPTPVDPTPVDPTPVDPTPVETAPIETAPVESSPVETPVSKDTPPTEPTSAPSAPTESSTETPIDLQPKHNTN